jgi:RHS repeat-associated protein
VNLHTGSTWNTYGLATHAGATINHVDGSCSNINLTGLGGANLTGATLNGAVNVCGTVTGGTFTNGATNDCAVECPVVRCEGGSKYYTATYRLIELPLYGSERLGQRNTDVVVSEQIFRQNEFAQAHFDYDGIQHTISQKQTLMSLTDQESTDEGLCIATQTLQTVEGSTQTINNLLSYYGASEDGLAMIEDENDAPALYAIAGTHAGVENTLLLFNSNHKLIKGQTSTAVDGKTKPHILQVPGSTTDYYVFARTQAGEIEYQIVDISADGHLTADGKVIASGLISGTGYGRHLASIEDLPAEKAYLYLTKYESGTNTLYKMTLDQTTMDSPQAGAVYTSADQYGEGQLEIAPDAQSILVYNHKRRMGWFDYSYSELLRIPMGEDYLPANEGQGYAYEHIAIKGGNLGVGQSSHSQENDQVYYSKNSLVLDAKGNYKGFYRQGLLVSNSMVTDELSATECGTASKQLAGGVLLTTTNSTTGVYQTDDLTATQVSTDITYTVTATGYVNGLPHQLDYDNEPILVLNREVGEKYYECKDHLGNVRAVISDQKIATLDVNDNIIAYEAELLNFTNYYPFGWTEPGRVLISDEYRYGFNGMEKDDEIKGSGNHYDFGARMYDSRLGKFLSLDPLSYQFPWASPYSFAGNDVIRSIDAGGLKKIVTIYSLALSNELNSTKVINWKVVIKKLMDREKATFNQADVDWIKKNVSSETQFVETENSTNEKKQYEVFSTADGDGVLDGTIFDDGVIEFRWFDEDGNMQTQLIHSPENDGIISREATWWEKNFSSDALADGANPDGLEDAGRTDWVGVSGLNRGKESYLWGLIQGEEYVRDPDLEVQSVWIQIYNDTTITDEFYFIPAEVEGKVDTIISTYDQNRNE